MFISVWEFWDSRAPFNPIACRIKDLDFDAYLNLHIEKILSLVLVRDDRFIVGFEETLRDALTHAKALSYYLLFPILTFNLPITVCLYFHFQKAREKVA